MATKAQTHAAITAAMAEVSLKINDNSSEDITPQDVRDCFTALHNIATTLVNAIQVWDDTP